MRPRASDASTAVVDGGYFSKTATSCTKWDRTQAAFHKLKLVTTISTDEVSGQ